MSIWTHWMCLLECTLALGQRPPVRPGICDNGLIPEPADKLMPQWADQVLPLPQASTTTLRQLPLFTPSPRYFLCFAVMIIYARASLALDHELHEVMIYILFFLLPQTCHSSWNFTGLNEYLLNWTESKDNATHTITIYKEETAFQELKM